MKKIVLVALFGLIMASCCNCYKASVRSQTPVSGNAWQLVQMDGRTFDAPEDAFVLTFGNDGRVSGRGSCNRLSGTYENDNSKGTLSMGAMVSTRMMCPDQQNEDRFVKLLGEVDGYTIDGQMLMLFTRGERKLMFERVAEK